MRRPAASVRIDTWGIVRRRADANATHNPHGTNLPRGLVGPYGTALSGIWRFGQAVIDVEAEAAVEDIFEAEGASKPTTPRKAVRAAGHSIVCTQSSRTGMYARTQAPRRGSGERRSTVHRLSD